MKRLLCLSLLLFSVVVFYGQKTPKLKDSLVGVYQQEVYNELWKDKKPVTDNPDWKKLTSTIKTKYGKEYADKVMLLSHIGWEEFKKDTASLLKHYVDLYDKYGVDTVGFPRFQVNNVAYYLVFMHSNDKAVLNKAAKWEEALMRTEPDTGTLGAFLDTYANLLYKAGKKEEALKHEKKAVELSPDNKELTDNYEKMQKGLPTW